MQPQIILILLIIAVANTASGNNLPRLARPTYFDNDTVQWFPEIIGGTPVKLEQMNGVVSIQNRYGHYLCSGTLVSYKLVLTAANCLLNQNGSLLDTNEIRVIADDIVIVGDGSATRQIQEIKNYYTRPSSGIALIELLNPFVETTSLTYNEVSNYTVSDGQICQLIGWGSSPPNSGVRLQQINVKIISNEVANSTKYYNSSMPTSTIAAIALHANNSCFGDLGSALVCDDFINGILSFGYGCSRSDFPIIFSNTYDDDLVAENRVNMPRKLGSSKPTKKPSGSNNGGGGGGGDETVCEYDENGEYVCGAVTIKLSIALIVFTVYQYFFNKFIT